MDAMKAFALVNLALAFLLELAALAAFAVWGFGAYNNTLLNILLGIGVPLIVAVFWGLFMAPTARKRVSGVVYYVLQAIVFGLAALALWAANQPVLAIVLAVVFVLNTAAVRLTRGSVDMSQIGQNRRSGG